MTYKTILTSKGTTTIPKEIRDQLGVKPGMLISFRRDDVSGAFVLSRAKTIDEIRKANKEALKASGTTDKQYVSGAGYALHVKTDLT